MFPKLIFFMKIATFSNNEKVFETYEKVIASSLVCCVFLYCVFFAKNEPFLASAKNENGNLLSYKNKNVHPN
jgi:hypothetical protein